MSKILCMDFNMTLFDHQTRGIYKFVLASVHNFNEMENLLMKDLLKLDGMIHANGSIVETNGHVLHEFFLKSDLLHSVILFALAH